MRGTPCARFLASQGRKRHIFDMRDGWLESVPAPTPMHLEDREGGVVAVPDDDLPPLSADQVRDTLEQVRR
jgi:hypothetical protein